MRCSVDFDDALAFKCDEVDRVSIDWMLAAKLSSRQSAIAQHEP